VAAAVEVDGKWAVAVNDALGDGRYDLLLPLPPVFPGLPGAVAFDGPAKFHFFAVRDGKVKVTAAALDMGALRWTLAGITGNWPVSDSTYGIDCLWIKKGGRWLGGKFDWERGDGNQVRPTSAHVQGGGGGFYKEWASIGGYAVGDEWRAAVYSKDGARRSNVVGGVVR
jgi:hypothetical protein